MNEIAISLPFSIDEFGKVTSTKEQSKIWQDRVRSVIGTALLERVMRPSFGTLIPSSVWESQEDALEQVKKEVQIAFGALLPLLTLGSVDVTFDEFSSIANISIVYDLPNEETVTTNIGFLTINGSNPPYQEMM